MNLFNKAIYKNHLEHTDKGTTWKNHKYLYITPSGRYVYESDLPSGQKRQEDQIRSAHQGEMARSQNQNVVRTSGTAIGTKKVSTPTVQNKVANRNTITIKSTPTTTSKASTTKISTSTASKSSTSTATAKTEEKKTDTATTNTGEKYKNMSEEMKTYLEKEAAKGEKKEGETKKGSGKKGGSGKKKGSSSSSKKSASTKTQEANQMGLSDDDLKNMEVNSEATNRDEVLKNIALRVIRGDYGNGADRKAKLGNYYDEVQKRVNELMKSGQINREGQSSQQASQKTGSNASGSSTKEYKREDYKKGDKDFDDKNYSDKNRLGNTDFFSYKRDDGKYVILEEDMKWVVDEKPSSKMIKNLEAMDEYIDARQKNGTWEAKNASKEWDQLASIAINGGDLTERAKAEKEKVKNKNKSVKHYDLEEGLFLKHFGTKRHSGRYPFGSGSRPYQHGGGPRRNSTFRERRSMSDEELASRINRARNEATLYREERNNRSEGQKFVEDVLTSVGRHVLTTAGKGALLWAGKQFATKVLEKPELGEFMARGGPEKKKK